MITLISDGWRNWRKNARIWYLLYLGKLALALIFTIPILIVVNVQLETSRYANILLTDWSLDLFIELTHARPNVFASFVIMLLFYAILVFIIKQFFNGGIYTSLLSREKNGVRHFMAQSGALFEGNLRISILMAIVYLVLLLVGFALGSMLPDAPFRGYGTVAVLPLILRFSLLYPFLILGTILSDLLRFQLAVHPERSFKERFGAAWELYRARFVQLNVTYYLYFLPFVAIWLVIEYQAIILARGIGSMFSVLLELVLFQVCSFLRTGQSLLGTATFACLIEKSAARPQQPGSESLPS